MKHYLYHRVPFNMQGTLLYPLTTIRNIYPTIYEEEVSKYNGREYVLNQRIPPLNCLWNDVIFMAAVHPTTVVENAIQDEVPFGRFLYYKIDIDQLDTSLLCVYAGILHSRMTNDNFTSFDIKKMDQYSAYPDVVHEYNRLIKEGSIKLFLPYCYIPHILYKGVIDISNVEIIRA